MKRMLLWSLLVATVTLAATARIVCNGFSGWDDPDNFTNNPRLNPPSVQHLSECWTTPQSGLYVPVTWTIWMTLAASAKGFCGANQLPAWPFHSASVLAHLAA